MSKSIAVASSSVTSIDPSEGSGGEGVVAQGDGGGGSGGGGGGSAASTITASTAAAGASETDAAAASTTADSSASTSTAGGGGGRHKTTSADVISTVRTRTSARLAVVRMAAAAAREKAAATSTTASSSGHHHHHHHGSHHHHHNISHRGSGQQPTGSGASDKQRHQVAPLKVQLTPPSSASINQHHHRHHSHRATRTNMYESYQLWAMKTYGDSAKTKTVTRKKYNRIMKTLKGEEQTKAENSKFRFWVKAKGFRIGPPPNHPNDGKRSESGVLYVLCPTQAKSVVLEEEEDDGGGGSVAGAVYKKVAVVENFFDIIYNVHVEMDGRGGKHAGQKKTYKAIAEMYAFLPREAVTKFLMQCSDCQKRMHPGASSLSHATFSTAAGTSSSSAAQQQHARTSFASSTAKSVINASSTCELSSSRPISAAEGAGAVVANPGAEGGGGEGNVGAGDENCMDGEGSAAGAPPEINFSLPITTTYLKHLRSLGYSEEEVLNENSGEMNDDVMDHEDSISNDVPNSNSDLGSPIPYDDQMSPNSCKEVSSPSSSLRPAEEEGVGGGYDDHPLDMTTAGDGLATSPDWSHHSASPSASPKWTNTNSSVTGNNTSSNSPGANSHQIPINMCRNGDASGVNLHSTSSSNNVVTSPSDFHHRYSLSSRHHSQRHHRHHRRSYSDVKASAFRTYPEPENCDDGAASVGAESNSLAVKDEDEEDDDEVDDEKTPQQCDPERLKAFNLFVRLFVDENLDRMVPISKQPKEKIQAIMDSCARQFPEFSERSRKRIRTYLKSCRRTKRCRDQNGWDPARPTPPHLTSAMAEQILATACENESTNAKRMRLGLEPICASLPGERDSAKRIMEPVIQQPSNLRSYISDAHRNGLPNGSLSHRIHSSVISNRGNSPSRYSAIKSEHKTSTTHFSKGSSLVNGPADLSTKRSHLPLGIHQSPGGAQSSQSKCPLNPSEVSAVRQLIAGYRESAAFLVRSADELEQLLLQQN